MCVPGTCRGGMCVPGTCRGGMCVPGNSGWSLGPARTAGPMTGRADCQASRLTQLSGKVLGEVTGRVIGAGVGLPGPVSFRDGVPVAPPIMPGWEQEDTAEHHR
jgi:hypothetical protein